MSFFATLARLAGSRQQENQLSQTFQACFNASSGFRRAALNRIAQACDAQIDSTVTWRCATQVAGPNGGRLDIHLSAPDLADQPVFVLESKVGSSLSREQLRRYRSRRKNATIQHLIAITKTRPDVPVRLLRKDRVRSLRWQDIHQTLTTESFRAPVDRFVASAFAQFLEDGARWHIRSS